MAYWAQRQAGSVIVYAVVGVLLAAAAVGAIIVVQNRDSADLTTPPQPTEVAQQDERTQDDADGDRAAKEAREAEVKREEAEERAAEAERTREADRREAESTEAPAPVVDASADGTAGSQADLPNTGPEQTTLGSIVGLVAIIGAGYGYYHFGVRR